MPSHPPPLVWFLLLPYGLARWGVVGVSDTPIFGDELFSSLDSSLCSTAPHSGSPLLPRKKFLFKQTIPRVSLVLDATICSSPFILFSGGPNCSSSQWPDCCEELCPHTDFQSTMAEHSKHCRGWPISYHSLLTSLLTHDTRLNGHYDRIACAIQSGVFILYGSLSV